MELKEKLKSLRASRGLTQEEAGSYLGVSAQTVSKWERRLLSPEIGLLPKIAVFVCLNVFRRKVSYTTIQKRSDTSDYP